MSDAIDFKLVVWRADEIAQRIKRGELGLPDFQRRFEWSTSDVKAYLSTVLGGLPSGAIMVADNRALRVALRELEGGPPIDADSYDALALLDGQQRLTALFQASFDVGPEAYFVNFAALESGANILEDDVVIAVRRGRPLPRSIDGRDLVPVPALRNEHSFFSWLNAEALETRSRSWGDVFSKRLHAIDRYPIPVTQLGGELDLATVAQIFERTNKWGQKLDAFDLLVARLQSGGWSLRSAWEEATVAHPAVARVFAENGLPAVSAIALRATGDVRRNAVLSLPPGRIETEWPGAIDAMDAVAQILLREGVRKPDLLAYDTLAIAMVAAKLNGASDELLTRYYWLGAMNRWHESGSNTRVVSDFRYLREGRLDPAMPTTLPPIEDLDSNTRRSSRALWCAMIGAMLTAEPRDLVTGEPVTSPVSEETDTWQLVPLIGGGGRAETSSDVPARLRTAAQLFASPGLGGRLRRHGVLRTLRERASQPSLFGGVIEDDMASQLLPLGLDELELLTPREIVRVRSQLILERVAARLRF